MAKETIREIGYNLTGKDLKNFEKVQNYLFMSIESLKSGLLFHQNSLKNLENERDFWEEVIKQKKNDNFRCYQDKAKDIVEKAKAQVEQCKKNVISFQSKLVALQNLYNTKFTNLPIENDVCVVEKDVVTYCNIFVETIVDCEE